MKLEEQIAGKIISVRSGGTAMVVAVCGAADLGKSHLSSNMVKALKSLGTSANHLTLDSYLMKRSERIKQGLSGYQPEAYDFSKVRSALAGFMNDQPISYYPYNHQSGTNESNKKYIGSCSVLILDAVHSMHQRFMPYVNFSLFVYTGDDLLRSTRSEADLIKRKQSVEFSRSNGDTEFQHYKQQVEPYKKRANCLLFLEYKWKYLLNE